MTKLASLRLVIPVGDDVSIEDLQNALRGALEPLATAVMEEQREPTRRIHWAAVDFYRYVERPPATPGAITGTASPRRKKVTSPQPALIPEGAA